MKVFYRLVGMMYVLGTFTLADTLESKLEALSKFQQSPKVIVLDYNPFVTEAMIEKLHSKASLDAEDPKSLKLLSVLNNRAFISGRWYGVGDRIDGGTIVTIAPTFVRIKRGPQNETLLFEKSKKLLHVKDTTK